MAITVYDPTLAGNTLPCPSDFEVLYSKRAAIQEMSNGALVRDIVNTTSKRRWRLQWNYMTAGEFTTLRSAFDATLLADTTFTDLNNVTYTVTIDGDGAELAFSRLKTTAIDAYTGELRLREV